jgi:hypothetical protein
MIMIIQPWREIPKFDSVVSRFGDVRFVEKTEQPIEMKTNTQINDSDWVNLTSIINPGTPAIPNVTSSDSSGMTIITNFFGFWSRKILLNGTFYDKIDMPGTSSQLATGNPAVPSMTEFLEIPHGVDITIEVTDFEVQFLEGYMVAPTQSPSLTLDNATRLPFVKDNVTYGTDLFYPYYNVTSNGVLASSSIEMRGRRLLELHMSPLQFNPVTGRIRVYSQIEIELSYSHTAQIESVDSALYSEAFEGVFKDFILNYQEWVAPADNTSAIHNYLASSDPRTSSYIPETGLIITYDEFWSEALRLADWKTRKGVYTDVIKTSDERIFGDAFQLADTVDGTQDVNYPDYNNLWNKIDALKEFMVYVFENWDPVPTYVLLFGDSNHIPSDYNISHRAYYTDTLKQGQGFPVHGSDDVNRIATDVTYFCVSGKGFLPDFIHGRLSVDDFDDARIIVDKILLYEMQPPESAVFYTDILVSSYFQDDYLGYGTVATPDRMEDEPFIITAENVSQHLTSLPNLVPYTVHKAYTTDVSIESDYRLYDYDTQVNQILNWQLLNWNSATSDIVENINEGRFLVYHIDHGSSWNFFWHDTFPQITGDIEGWAKPEFKTLDFVDLDNQDRMPLVISIDCQTGWFDGEIDALIDPDLLINADSFSEEFIRWANGLANDIPVGGAIAAIAPTRTSFTIPGADLALGITNAFWPGILYANSPISRLPVYNMGTALLRGKMFIAREYGAEVDFYRLKNTTLLVYHLFGDPETPLWTGIPSQLEVNHPTLLDSGSLQSVVVTVTDGTVPVTSGTVRVSKARVCLQKGSEVYAVDITDSNGEVTFLIEPLTSGILDITVTKQNYIPITSTIDIQTETTWPLCLLLLSGSFALIILVILAIRKKITIDQLIRRIREVFNR